MTVPELIEVMCFGGFRPAPHKYTLIPEGTRLARQALDRLVMITTNDIITTNDDIISTTTNDIMTTTTNDMTTAATHHPDDVDNHTHHTPLRDHTGNAEPPDHTSAVMVSEAHHHHTGSPPPALEPMMQLPLRQFISFVNVSKKLGFLYEHRECRKLIMSVLGKRAHEIQPVQLVDILYVIAHEWRAVRTVSDASMHEAVHAACKVVEDSHNAGRLVWYVCFGGGGGGYCVVVCVVVVCVGGVWVGCGYWLCTF